MTPMRSVPFPLCLAPADAARAGVAGTVAEIARFRLAAGVTEAAFLDAARKTGAFVCAAPGFVARRLSRNADGTWTDYVEWTGMEAAAAAAEALMADPAARPFLETIDPATVEMRHEPILWQME